MVRKIQLAWAPRSKHWINSVIFHQTGVLPVLPPAVLSPSKPPFTSQTALWNPNSWQVLSRPTRPYRICLLRNSSNVCSHFPLSPTCHHNPLCFLIWAFQYDVLSAGNGQPLLHTPLLANSFPYRVWLVFRPLGSLSLPPWCRVGATPTCAIPHCLSLPSVCARQHSFSFTCVSASGCHIT